MRSWLQRRVEGGGVKVGGQGQAKEGREGSLAKTMWELCSWQMADEKGGPRTTVLYILHTALWSAG